jgi:hypothetical protein
LGGAIRIDIAAIHTTEKKYYKNSVFPPVILFISGII